MHLRIRHAYILIVLSALPLVAFSKECLVIPAVSVCGIPLKAPQAAFEKELGEPDGRINMGKDRVGLLYGPNFMVIFSRGKLWEIHNWSRPTIRDATNWFNYVGLNRADRDTQVVFQGWNPWDVSAPTERMRAVLSKMPPVSGDEYSDFRRIKGGSVFILYGEQEIGDRKERADRVRHLEVNFGGEPRDP